MTSKGCLIPVGETTIKLQPIESSFFGIALSGGKAWNVKGFDHDEFVTCCSNIIFDSDQLPKMFAPFPLKAVQNNAQLIHRYY